MGSSNGTNRTKLMPWDPCWGLDAYTRWSDDKPVGSLVITVLAVHVSEAQVKELQLSFGLVSLMSSWLKLSR